MQEVDISIPPIGPREVYMKAVEGLPLVQVSWHEWCMGVSWVVHELLQ